MKDEREEEEERRLIENIKQSNPIKPFLFIGGKFFLDEGRYPEYFFISSPNICRSKLGVFAIRRTSEIRSPLIYLSRGVSRAREGDELTSRRKTLRFSSRIRSKPKSSKVFG